MSVVWVNMFCAIFFESAHNRNNKALHCNTTSTIVQCIYKSFLFVSSLDPKGPLLNAVPPLRDALPSSLGAKIVFFFQDYNFPSANFQVLFPFQFP